MKNITFNLNKATTGPVINQVTDVRTKSVNLQITPGKNVIINGANLLIKGDNPANGVFFTKDEEGATPQKVEFFSRSTTSEQIVEVPEGLADGQYKVSITTQAGASYSLLKEPRTYVFPILLTVGKLPEAAATARARTRSDPVSPSKPRSIPMPVSRAAPMSIEA